MVIAVANQKGGVAKTTCVHNLGAALSIIRKESFADRFRQSGKPYNLRGIGTTGY